MQDETDIALFLHRATGWARLRGLIGRPPPGPGAALMFFKCRSVHGWLMRYPIDVVFVDDAWRVMRVVRLRPWRAVSCRRAAHVLELRAGEAERLGLVPGATVKKNFAEGG